MGVGCVVVGDHVAIYQARITRAADGALQRSETVQRVRTMQEACGVLGCDCSEPHHLDGVHARPAQPSMVAPAPH